MRNNELLITPAVANTAENSETKAPFSDTVTEYQFGKATYTVRLHFNLEAKRSLKDIVGDMICRDLDKSA